MPTPIVFKPLRRAFALAVSFGAIGSLPCLGQNQPSGSLSARLRPFQARLRQIMRDPRYRHADFGIAIYSLSRRKMLFHWNGGKLFTPASTTKLVTEGCALQLFGPDYRFHTRIYRTGAIRRGTLAGSLVLVAGGDPNLSARVQPDGTLAFENWDHSYDGSRYTRAVPGNPLRVLNQLARRLAAQGLRKINGGVYVDTTLFPEGRRELGTGVVISPIVVNDNLVDLTLGPGTAAGQPVTIAIAPQTGYVSFINQALTSAPGSLPNIRFSQDVAAADGTHRVTISGEFPAGQAPILYAYAVPQPSRFAQFALAAALHSAGIAVQVPGNDALPAAGLSSLQQPGRELLDYASPKFAQEVKVTLKVSQNLHASMMPYLEGSLLAHRRRHIVQGGFALERKLLSAAGLDLSGASQSDGAGGSGAAFFSPDFMVHYLAWMAGRPQFPWFYRALPVLGRDGTLFNIQTHSPAAGHVRAKTGTYDEYDALNRDLIVTGKGLAGYMTTAANERLAFAFYINRVSLPLGGLGSIERTVGESLGQLATAAYELPAPDVHNKN